MALLSNSLLWILGAAILGFLVAWFLKNGTIRKWETQLKDKETEYAQLQNERNDVASKYNSLKGNFEQLKTTNKDLTANVASLETKVNNLEKEASTAAQNKSATTSTATKSVNISDNSHELQLWKSKFAKLERDLLSKERELAALQSENENIFTKLEILESTVESAKAQEERALLEIKKHEAYKSRFEEANLERNSFKYKYEQLLTAKDASNDVVEQLKAENEALLNEIANLKTTIANTIDHTEEWNTRLSELEIGNRKASKKFEEIKIKYDSLLVLHERTEEKMKAMIEATNA